MNTENTKRTDEVAPEGGEPRGRLFYDDQCPMCVDLALRAKAKLTNPGIALVPINAPETNDLIPVSREELMGEMKLMTERGEIIGGADALVYLAPNLRWGWPIRAMARIPGGLSMMRASYRLIARNRYGLSKVVSPLLRLGRIGWLITTGAFLTILLFMIWRFV
ncbi:DUF393 domain-containing protein [Candidatus Sumerlaeota bacterium]|nr:DUF393 domain-containing protein [Candidatus Sumerlaeota bacterium]MBI3734902.1 DUF393 domain-containing protein [Candidatus Sumerlaeota bacterium]